MTATRKLIDLFRAIGSGDLEGAASIAAAVASDEEKSGHRSAARMLRGALASNGNGVRNHDESNGVAALAGRPAILSSALVRVKDARRLEEVELADVVKKELDDVIVEWKQRHRLSEIGIRPRSKLLFHGPPGCGKSLTATALGHELGLPVYVVRFDAIIGAFLGQTAIHLRQLFYFAETTPCVLLLDELDALGKRRGNPLDVGELDRIVIALMQELEHSKPLGMIIGTSNLPKHLDNALWRRFDLDVLFKAPTAPALKRFVNRIAASREVVLPAAVRRRALSATSFAAAEAVVISEVRRQALEGFQA